jgi:hypothetical protein
MKARWLYPPLAFAIATAAAAAALAGCSKDDGATPPAGNAGNGEQIYAQMCKSCHGAQGEGGSGPVLRDEYLKHDLASLVGIVDARMPLGQADRCRGQCANDVGAFVFEKLRGPIVCQGPKLLARGVRLLSKREYAATVADLFGIGSVTAPAATTCGPTTFTYDPQGRALTTVHVAGSFNGWAGTIAAGGWPLAKAPSGTWSLVKPVPQGSYQYKLVLNESEWITDPTDAKSAPDGLGGQNSVLDVTCGGGTAGGGGTSGGGGAGTTSLDVTATFPPDTRPEGFPFDDNGPGRVVTSDLMDEYVRAAAKIAAAVDLAKVVTCDKTQRDACAATFSRDLGKRVFRRPLTDAEVARFAKVVTGASDFDTGARAAIRAMLIAPSFAYRTEVGAAQPDGTFRLTPYEVASALSYFFWGTMPDAALFAAADKGDLAGKDGIEREARRLLADPRARDTIGTFAEQWLGIESLPELTKADAYPFDPSVRAAMREETRRLVEYVVFDGSHHLDEIFTADYTFANAALAKHYGLAGAGQDFTKVKYPDGTRAGILGHGSILASTGHSDQTSPIRRGLFVRRRLLCQEFAPPPPNAGSVPKVDPSATTRERFAQHTADPFCKSCHQYIDDVGFGFERFDTVGRARDTEAGKPIDAQGDMNDVEGFGKGTHAPFSTMAELGHVLASSDAAKTCIARQVYRFARGQLDDDVCQIAPIKQRFFDSGGDLRELLVAVVTDPSFVGRAP